MAGAIPGSRGTPGGRTWLPGVFLLALSLVEWVFNPLLSTIHPRLLAIVWSRDGLFGPPRALVCERGVTGDKKDN